MGDVTEIAAMREVFGNNMPPINSTKSLTGHSPGAAGVHEAIYSLLQMQNGFIAECANIEEIDPEVGDAPIVRKRIDNAKIARPPCPTASALAAPTPRWFSSGLTLKQSAQSLYQNGTVTRTEWLKPQD